MAYYSVTPAVIDDPAVFQPYQGISHIRNLLHLVGHVENGNPEAGAQGPDIREQFFFACLVQGCQGFVHEQQPRAAQQGPADGHPLFFTAGQPGRPVFQQLCDPQKRHHRIKPHEPVRRLQPAHAKRQVILFVFFNKIVDPNFNILKISILRPYRAIMFFCSSKDYTICHRKTVM
jgi:hypothetical protein